MSVIITKEDLIAYAEVDYIIKHMNERYVSKLPENLINFFDTMKDPDYKINIQPYKPLSDQGLQKYTLEIIALLHIKYWCQNKERKEELLEKMRANQEKFENHLREQFNTDNIFNNNNNKAIEEEEDKMTKAYAKYTQNNPDIEDYTDLRQEVKNSESLTETVQEKKSIFEKLKKFISKMFSKNTD